MAEPKTGFFRTAGGWVVELDLPLNEEMQGQLVRHQLTPVANAAGDAANSTQVAEAEQPKRPSDSAAKSDWVGYALKVDSELSVDDADAMTKNDLIEKYGK
jgi:hypothetical protein